MEAAHTLCNTGYGGVTRTVLMDDLGSSDLRLPEYTDSHLHFTRGNEATPRCTLCKCFWVMPELIPRRPLLKCDCDLENSRLCNGRWLRWLGRLFSQNLLLTALRKTETRQTLNGTQVFWCYQLFRISCLLPPLMFKSSNTPRLWSEFCRRIQHILGLPLPLSFSSHSTGARVSLW